MNRCRISVAWRFAVSLLLGGCVMGERGTGEKTPAGACEDADRDGYGRGCANGYDCDDADPKVMYQCRACSQPDHGCPCTDEGAVESCFLPARELADGKLQCSEGTRVCRDAVWSGCEQVHEYVIDAPAQAQGIVVPTAGRETCNGCDLKCFKVIDDLLREGGVADGSVTFGPGGGLTLLPGDGGVGDGGTGDAGPIGQPGCAGLAACCATLSGPLGTACSATVTTGDNARCDREKAVYCPSGTITGPVPNCTLGSGADTDCDGIPNAVDTVAGRPFSSTTNQTIFHQLDVGESGQNSIDVSFKVKNADVYFLLDTTGTMIDERDNLLSTLTTGNVVNCAQLSQCCNGVAACTTIVNGNNQTNCYNAQPTYCGKHVDCADANSDGAPDNQLKSEGVIGAVRCLVGTSWFGTGAFRDIPAHKEPEPTPVSAEGQRYGDRDELIFRHLIDMTPDYEAVRSALAGMSMNYNWDEPEGGFLALNSLVSGRGHYFGVNRPGVAERTLAQGCDTADAFGYACFRRDAVPVVVFLSDAPHHMGPPDSTNCNSRGSGCPYSDLTTSTSWTSGAAESASDRRAQYASQNAETFSTAYSLGDVRGQYFSVIGNTDGMAGDYPTTIIGCGAASGAPEALITFSVSPGSNIPVNIKLTKNDAYSSALYGNWNPSWLAAGSDDPSPATEFGAVISLFKGIPSAVSTTIDVKDTPDTTVASGPNNAYLSYIGTTKGGMSVLGLWGGISGCAADGQTNQSAFSFRPGADSRIVFDATGSSFPVTMSLHESKLTGLPSNPPATGITNNNDTFATAHAIPGAIDGNYVERLGDSNLPSVRADYTSKHTLTVTGVRTNGSNQIKGLTHTNALYPGLPISNAMGWAADPVTIASVNGSIATMSAKWNGTTDALATSITFDDTLVGCNADPMARETVFRFDVDSPRRVRIDTEGSSYDTVISLHDGAPATAVMRNDVSGNGVAPGYDLGELTSKMYTLSDVGVGTTALPNTYDFVQCGGAAAARDAVFRFELAKQTRIGLDVQSSSWDPIVGLFTATPGQATILTNPNLNDRIAPPGLDAFAVGDVLGQVSTRVNGSTLAGMADDYPSSVVGCLAAVGARDQVFKFTPSGRTTLRVQAEAMSAFYPVVAVFDGPPPVSSAATTVQAYNASSVTLPESSCVAYSYHDPSTGSASPHVYTLCPSRRYADDANTRCATAGMNYLAIVNNAGEQSFLASLVAPTTTNYGHHIGAHIPSGSTFLWRDASPLTYTNWALGEPNETAQKCAAMQKGGRWEDKRCTSSGAAADDNAFYLCEDIDPAVKPAENLLTAQLIDPKNRVVSVEGSTLRMSNDYNGATLMGGCGGTVGAGDAVFKIVTGAAGAFTVSADTAGSSYSPVIGLFDGSIDSAGYLTCDASGGAPLTYSLLSSKTYYIVVDGTASSAEGAYKLKLSDTSQMNTGVRMACHSGSATMSPTSSVDVEVEANHTYYVVVDSASAASGPYTLQLSALYQSRATVANTGPTNERGVSAFSLPDPYRSKISVVDTTTGGMSADYSSSVICSAASDSPDAVYKFRPSQATGLRFTATPKGAGLTTPVLGLFDGPPVTTPVLHNLAADGNTNEAFATAELVSFGSSTRRYDGSTTAMTPDTDVSLAACGASPLGRDAMFAFSLTAATEVEIDASASAMPDPVLRLFKSGPQARPTATALQNDDRAAANVNPASPPEIGGSWLHYTGDMASLTSGALVQSSFTASNDDSASPTPVPQDLGDLAGRRVTLGGANTSAMQADYPGVCGAADDGKDALYRFTSSMATQLHVKATPAPGYDMVLGLYEGAMGGPLRQIDASSQTEDKTCAMSPVDAPRNVTRPTLLAMEPNVAAAVDVDLDCGNPSVDTSDPDGAGALIVTFANWCGPQPQPFVQTQSGGPDAVVFLMNSLRVQSGTTLRVHGNRPAIFVVTNDATIEGALNADGDVASSTPGAGGGVACGASTGANGASALGYSGGGGGGGYATVGGIGGAQVSLAGGSAGAARGNTQLVPLLGGCNGGRSDVSVNPGVAGGALQISALGDLVVTGSIEANGGNGIMPALSNHGGSGGGSGGAILIEASNLSFTASMLHVNGGDGASGAGSGAVAAGGTGSISAAAVGGNGQAGSATRSGGGAGGGYGRTRAEQRTLSLQPCVPDTHEAASSAATIDAGSSSLTFVEQGDTRDMRHDHDLSACGAAASAHDAVYAFTLSQAGDVRFDAAASPNTTVVGIYETSALVGGSAPLDCLRSESTLDKTLALPAGDYRVVVSSKLANSGDAYELRLRNLSHASAAATEVSCDASGQSLTYNLQANTPYYLIVKGTSAAESGGYDLYLETPGSGASMGCGASPGAADAVYKFHLGSQRAVSIDTENSLIDTVIALYPGSATSFGSDYATDATGLRVDCDDDGGVIGGASRIDATLSAGDYYLVVKRKTLTWAPSAQPYRVSIRDSEATSPLACASAATGGKKILQLLQPGDYHVVVSGTAVDGGAYSVKFRDVSHFGLENGVQLACVSGSTLTYPSFEANKDYYVVVKGNGATESGAYDLTVEDTVSLSASAGSTAVACAAEGSRIDGVYPPGTYYALVSGNAAATGGSYTLNVQDLDAQNDQNRLACDDNGGPNLSSAIEADLAAGTHYVVVKGKSPADVGSYRLRIRDVDGVDDHRLLCAGGASGPARMEYDVKAGRDYTLLLKGGSATGSGDYALKMYDAVSAPSASGSRLACEDDPQPTPLRNSTWDRRTIELNQTLAPDTYYVAVKGVRATDAGYYQLQVGQTSARTSTTYTPPTWSETRDALVASGVHVLPVIATGGESHDFVAAAEAQAKVLATATGAVRADGTPIWQRINRNGTGTGTALVSAIAELATHLAMNVSLYALDGPDPGASRFKVDIAPVNSPNCVNPHPLLDGAGVCSSMSGSYNCNTHYQCRPGAAPKFRVTFTNPETAPVPPNPNNPTGGYLFKLQLKGDDKFVLDEIPVFLLPTSKMVPPPPGTFRTEGVYAQDVDATSCKLQRKPDGTYEFNPRSTDLPQWRDLYFHADIPEGASIDFELCTSDDVADLASCEWSDQPGSKREKVTVTSQGTCVKDGDCLDVPGFGDGFCSDTGQCQFINKPSVIWDLSCNADSECPNGPFGAGKYRISSHCEKDSSAYGYGHCVYHSVPVDIGGTLLPTEDGRLFSRIRIKLHSTAAGNVTPTLYDWYLTYRCQSSL